MKKHRNKYTLLLACLLVTVAIVVSGTIAYLFTASDPVTNTFKAVLPGIEIPEEMKGTIKENATIKNTGEVDSFLRARIIVTWQNDNGEVYPEVPVLDTDYTMSNGANWQKVDVGNSFYYYYKKIAAPGQPAVTQGTNKEIVYGTGVTADDMLIIRAEVKKEAPAAGYTLHIEILGQAIQANPIEAVQETWGMTYTAANGTGSWSTYSAGSSK